MSAVRDPIITNVHVYRDIATEALQAAETSLASHRRPKEGAELGYVLLPDHDRRSFRQSLIAVVFAGMFIEATLWLLGATMLGVEAYIPIDKKPLEDRLYCLGIDDKVVAAKLKSYREARKELVHEKAVPLSMDRRPMRTAQTEAKKAVELMLELEALVATRGPTKP